MSEYKIEYDLQPETKNIVIIPNITVNLVNHVWFNK